MDFFVIFVHACPRRLRLKRNSPQRHRRYQPPLHEAERLDNQSLFHFIYLSARFECLRSDKR